MRDVLAVILCYFIDFYIALQAYVAAAEDRPIMSAKYSRPITFDQN